MEVFDKKPQQVDLKNARMKTFQGLRYAPCKNELNLTSQMAIALN